MKKSPVVLMKFCCIRRVYAKNSVIFFLWKTQKITIMHHHALQFFHTKNVFPRVVAKEVRASPDLGRGNKVSQNDFERFFKRTITYKYPNNTRYILLLISPPKSTFFIINIKMLNENLFCQ